MSWPQLAIWSVIKWDGEKANLRNLGAVLPLPPSATVAHVIAMFGALLRTCETFRTTYAETGGTRPEQQVHGSGRIAVHLYEAAEDTADECAEEAFRELNPTYFDAGTDMPVVLGIVSSGARALRAIAVFSHMAVDGWSMRLLEQMFEEVLRSGPRAFDKFAKQAEQPLDLAAYEQSPAAVAEAQQALGFWRAAFAEIPLITFAGGAERDVKAERARMSSPGLARAVRAIVDREQVSASAVVTGSAAIVLSTVMDISDIALRSILAARTRPQARYSIAALNLNGLFRLRVDPGPAGQHFQRSMAASLAAIAHSHCDPQDLDDELDAITSSRGVSAKQYMFFNDLGTREDGNRSDADDDRLSTQIQTLPEDHPDKDSKFMLTSYGENGVAMLELYVDRRFLSMPPADMLRCMELVTIEAADNPRATVADLQKLCR